MPNLELASTTAVVAAGAETKVSTTSTNVVADAAISLTVESLAEAEIAAAREDKQGTSGGPWFLCNDVLIDRDHGVVGAKNATQRPDAVVDTFDSCADAFWDVLS